MPKKTLGTLNPEKRKKYSKNALKWLIGMIFCGAWLLGSLVFSLGYSWGYFVDIENLSTINNLLSAYAVSGVLLSLFAIILMPLMFHNELFRERGKSWMYKPFIPAILVLFVVPLLVGTIILTVRWVRCNDNPTISPYCNKSSQFNDITLRYYRSQMINGYISLAVFIVYMACWAMVRSNMLKMRGFK